MPKDMFEGLICQTSKTDTSSGSCRDFLVQRSRFLAALKTRLGLILAKADRPDELDRNFVQVSDSCGPQTARAQFIVDAQPRRVYYRWLRSRFEQKADS